MVKKAAFVSIWDGGTEVISPCMVDTTTKEVFNIETIECDVDELDEEKVIVDGEEYPVYQSDDAEDGDYWYD